MQSSGSFFFAFSKLHVHAGTVQRGSLMTRHMWCFSLFFFREAGSPVARQVVHAGVHRFFFL